jgi:hypothetical protein
MKAPPGSLVRLYYDSPREIQIGDVLMTHSGRIYIIAELRRQTRGRHVGRWHVKAIVGETIPEGSITHPIYWYRRNKKRR